MKKILILSLLCIVGITKTDNNTIQVSTDIIKNITKTLYGMSFVSGIKTLMNLPLIAGFNVKVGNPSDYTRIFLKSTNTFKAMAAVKTSFWGSLGVLCYNGAEKLMNK